MQIIVNGQQREVPNGLNMAGLIELLHLGGQRVAIEVNEELVPRSSFSDHRLQHRDRVEIIGAVGGG